MQKMQLLKDRIAYLNLTEINRNIENILQQASVEKMNLTDYSIKIFEHEVNYRRQKAVDLKLKKAKLPINHNLETFDFNHQNGISKQQLSQLRELFWLEQNFNLLIMGPSGTGKSFLAAGLVSDAINNGYKALFRTADQIIQTLKLKDITRSATVDYKLVLKADLLVIDDLMMFPIEKNVANQLFNLINNLHERASIIITTNKSPKQWAKVLDDEVLATAILDRLLYRCEIINLTGDSFRLKNRKSIF
ncbi:MAG: AAA domain-containing protein [Bacteroidetes bacterium]|jgi:DNA replication protein DnaC|uniref:AAA+ ATPase domain-containing protein n=2 Tax=marine sediment metagenome TaxID=412755 RepID=X1QRH9_9ZZZZ|nr:AAA domain-containing protein [Bacteroidota bacterium]